MRLAAGSAALLERDVSLWVVKSLANVALARMLGPAAMGLWLTLAMIPSYAEAVGRLKLDVGAVYFLGRGRYPLGKVSFALNLAALVSGGTLVLVAIWQMGAVRTYLLKDIPGTDWLVYGVLASVPIHFAYMNYGYLLIALEDVRSYNRMVSLREGLAAGLPVLLIGLFGWGVGGIVLGALVGGLVGLAYGVVRVERVERMSFGLDLTVLRDLAGYSWKLYVMGLLGHLNAYIAGPMVALYLRPEQVAFFRMGQDHAQLLGKIPAAISTVLYPRISKLGEGRPESRELVAKGCRVSLLAMAVLGALGVAAVRPLVGLLYGEEYVPLVLAFVILVPGVVVSSAAAVLGQYFMGAGRPGVLLGVSALSLATQLGLGMLLMPAYGFAGAAAATSVAWIMTGGATVALFGRASGMSARAVVLANRADAALVRDLVRSQVRRLGSVLGLA